MSHLPLEGEPPDCLKELDSGFPSVVCAVSFSLSRAPKTSSGCGVRGSVTSHFDIRGTAVLLSRDRGPFLPTHLDFVI